MSLAKDIKDIEFDVMQDLADSIKADFLKERSTRSIIYEIGCKHKPD